MEQHPALEGKAGVHVPLSIAGAWFCWFLLSVEYEPFQSLEYAVHLFIHSFINIHQCCFGTTDDSGRLESACATLQVLPRDSDGIYERVIHGD